MPKKKKKIDWNKKYHWSSVNRSLFTSIIFASYFLCQLFVLIQSKIVYDVLGSPFTLVAVPSAMFAVYAFIFSDNEKQRYVAVSVLTVLVVGMLVWLFGVTSAGSGLANEMYGVN